jgi:hypothetical protein
MTEKSVLPPSVQDQSETTPKNQENLPKTELNEQSSLSSSSDPRNLAKRILKGYRMKIRKGTKRFTLYRFLLAKLLHDEEGLHIDEYIVLNELHFHFLESSEESFIQAHENHLKNSGKILSQIRDQRSFPIRMKCFNLPDNVLRECGIPTAREYFGLRGQRDLKRSFVLILEDSLMPQKLSPARYIGVGYKDKGTCRQPARDGSPSWQEVATVISNNEREAEDSSFTEYSLTE